MRSPYTEHDASGLPNPTHLEWEAEDQQMITTRSPRIVLIKCMFMTFTVDFMQELFDLSESINMMLSL